MSNKPSAKSRSELLRIIAVATRALEKKERQFLNKCDWRDPDARKKWIRQFKMQKRRMLIPESRICPGCSTKKQNVRAWVTKGGKALCRGCYMRRRNAGG